MWRSDFRSSLTVVRPFRLVGRESSSPIPPASSLYIYGRRFDPRRLLDDSSSLLPADYRQRELVSTSSGVRFGDGSET